MGIATNKSSPTSIEEYPQTFIDSVRAASDITKVVGQYVQLKSSGSNLFGLCPFHSEKSPSFSVSPKKQMYHCFGCGANGDAIAFLKEHAGLTFREAVAELAELAHIPLPASGTASNTPGIDFKGLVQTNETAANFFRHCLRHTDSARTYLHSRKVPPEAAKSFVIGYAPQGWQSLQEAFPDYSSNTNLLELGLLIEKEERRYDRFRDRLMFGIRDARGRIVGFGGRSMDGSEPKYLNSPHSALFDKGNQLFGLFEARESIRRLNQIIAVEGYFDTVAISLGGIGNVVATMGTACTELQVERMVALASEVVFSFDGDKAGIAAAWRSLNTCLPFATDERSFRFLILPEGKDPDELIQERGIEAFRDHLTQAMSLSTFMISHLKASNDNLKSAENRARFLSEGQALIERLPGNGNLRRILRNEMHEACGLPAPAVRQHRPARQIAHQTQTTSGPWMTLTVAVQNQRKTASLQAPGLIECLPKAYQDAFFESNFSVFSPSSQPFWKALEEVILMDAPQDSEGEMAQAQRDLLQRSASVLEGLLQREERERALEAFRAGKTTEEEYLHVVQSLAQKQDPSRAMDRGEMQ
jgi:DNA primase catalytic core